MVLRIEDENGIDLTSDILNIPDYGFILVSYDLCIHSIPDWFKKINTIALSAARGRIFIYRSYQWHPRRYQEIHCRSNEMQFPLYNADDVILKTMVRSNPGLILIKGRSGC